MRCPDIARGVEVVPAGSYHPREHPGSARRTGAGRACMVYASRHGPRDDAWPRVPARRRGENGHGAFGSARVRSIWRELLTMWVYVVRRLLLMIPVLILVSM